MDPTVLGVPWKRQLWHKWKALRNIPFRKNWFVGYDLEGNTYWELIDRNNPTRLRRKVSLDRPYFHFSDFKPHPMWMQWLQYTRRGPPTLTDLVEDMRRQHRMKLLAQRANEKWKSIPLKTSSSGNASDPRLGTAWTGEGTSAESAEEAVEMPRFEEPQGNERNNEVMAAMRQAEEQIRKTPKVMRQDPHVAVAKKSVGTQRADTQSSRPNAPSEGEPPRSNKDEPKAAFLKPKPRS